MRSRLFDMEQSRQDAELSAERRTQVGTGDRSEKIRTYNFPQDRITDHRVGLTVHNIPDRLDGNLDDIIDAVAYGRRGGAPRSAGVNSRQAAASAASRLSEAGVAEARFEAEYLVREAAGISRAAFFADAPVRGETKDTLDRWVGRRAGREPGAYITGHREFFGREFRVGPGVLIPRPETELLVELGLRELDRSPHATVFEAGTGSGAVAVSLAASRPQARVWRATSARRRSGTQQPTRACMHPGCSSLPDTLPGRSGLPTSSSRTSPTSPPAKSMGSSRKWRGGNRGSRWTAGRMACT